MEHRVQAIIGRAFMGLSGIKDRDHLSAQSARDLRTRQLRRFRFSTRRSRLARSCKIDGGANQLLGMAAQNSIVAGVRPQGMEDTAQLKLDIDRDKATTLGVTLADINNTIQSVLRIRLT